MSPCDPTASIDLYTGNPIGTISKGCPFNFVCSPAPGNQVQITGTNSGGKQENWFLPNPAYVEPGSISVQVMAQELSPPGGWSYQLVGMNEPYNPHIVVGDSMQDHAKAS